MNLKHEIQTFPPPPGIIGSLRAGFDTIAAHISAILLPLALDVLLWLGPHISMNQLIQPVLLQFQSFASNTGISTSDLKNAMDMYTQFFQQFNLLGVLRTFPIGVPSLMSGEMPLSTPIGTPMIWQIDSFGQLFGLLLLLTICGWIFGGIYFRWIAALIVPDSSTATAPAILQTVLYSLVWLILAWMIGLPIGLLLYILFAINSLIGEGALLVLGFLSMWLIVPLFFSSFGIYLRKQNVFVSFLSGLQMTRFALPTSSLFVLTMLLIGFGLNFLWAIPENNSWLTLVGILGHAFIVTALVASSFAYYRDTTAWLQSVMEKLRAATPTTQA
ncbi:MAG TPA: hypothetical protein VLX61_07480 [Anaerolineales bacterium]|nr:hypothetical protein [Anaerolineales bacterium]